MKRPNPFILAITLVLSLSFSLSSARIASTSTPVPTLPLGSELQRDIAGWKMVGDWGQVNAEMLGSPLASGAAILRVNSGTDYAGAYFWNLLPGDASTAYVYSLDFWISEDSCNNAQGVPSLRQSLEVASSKYVLQIDGKITLRYETAVQFENVSSRGSTYPSQVRFWKGEEGWQSFEVPWLLCLTAGWHNVTIVSNIIDGYMHYQSVTIDCETRPLDIKVAPVVSGPNNHQGNGTVVAFQSNLNSKGQGYDVHINHVNLLGNGAALSPPTARPTVTAVPTSTVGLLPLDVQMAFQRSGAGLPGPRYITCVTARLYSVNPVSTRTPLAMAAAMTDANGAVAVTLPNMMAGVYDVNINPAHALSVERKSVPLPGSTSLIFGTAPEGDANGDDAVTILDFSLLATSFNKSIGQPGFDPRTDFNQDGVITILDFSLLASNFNRIGPVMMP